MPVTHAGVLGQVWRGGGRQARLSQALTGVDVHPVDEDLGRTAGELLGTARQSDVIDAAIILISKDGDDVITSDPDDLKPLAAAAGRHIELIRP
jgi:hypothetical protein